MHVLVDTNVFLDLILKREGLYQEAKAFFHNAILSKTKIFISSMSIRDIGYLAKRHYHSEIKGKEAQMRAYQLSHKVVSLTNDDAIEALYSDVKDYEDASLVESAKRAMVDVIITNNVKDFENAKISVWTPEFFNKIIERR